MFISKNGNLINALSRFNALTLSELERVSLLDRMDTKYVFSESILPDLLNRLNLAGYCVLEIDGIRAFRYSSMYYDTDDFSLYQRHAAGKMNRYKVRKRDYVDTGGSFFEIKFKNNKGRTVKSRVGWDNINGHEKASLLLSDKTPFDLELLKEQLQVNYTRITLVGPDFKERITIDMGLSYVLRDKSWKVEGIVIAELKQNRTTSSVFGKVMKDYHLRPSSLSKYCLGIARLSDTVKKNNFKPQLLLVNKIQHATTTRP